MKTTALALLGALALAPALSACNTETTPAEDTATIVPADSIQDGVADLNDSLAMDADASLDSIGAATGDAVDATGNAIENAAGDVRDAVDENVDLGENAENQGGN